MELADVTISLIVVFVLVAFFGWMGYSLISTKFEKTPEAKVVSSENFTFSCLPGQCSTDIETGIKTCPVDPTASMVVDPRVSVCNSAYLCDNPLTPYAKLSDGATTSSGVCAAGIKCPCLKQQICPDYVISIFTSSNGNPYSEVNGQRILFPQQSSFVSNTGGSSVNTPFSLSNSDQFCLAPNSWLSLSSPGCPMFSGAMDYNQLVFCMGGARGCHGLNNNPCLQGTLAVIANDSATVTADSIPLATLGCVRGNPCPCDELAIFDLQYGGVVCRKLT